MTSTTATGTRAQIAFPELALIAMPLWKRSFDVLAALLGLVVLAPLFALLSLLIVVESRGNPLYRHARVGRGGKIFTCWKFRSMYLDAEEMLDSLREHNEANGNSSRCARTRDGRGWGPCCARSGSTRRRSCGTCCAAR